MSPGPKGDGGNSSSRNFEKMSHGSVVEDSDSEAEEQADEDEWEEDQDEEEPADEGEVEL